MYMSALLYTFRQVIKHDKQANYVHVCPVGCGTPSCKLTMCMSVLWAVVHLHTS